MRQLAVIAVGVGCAIAIAPARAVADPDALLDALAAASTPPSVRHYGLMMDAGAPEGAQVSLVVRPIRALRLHGGAGYNGISTGLEGGATLIPFSTWFTPTLTADYGEFPDGDATWLVRLVDPSASSPVLRHIGYHYENARVGLEFGRKRATFYVHAGISRITGTVHDVASALDSSSTVMVSTSDPRIEAWTVSARIGLIVYFGP